MFQKKSLIISLIAVCAVFCLVLTADAAKGGGGCKDKDNDGYFQKAGCGSEVDCDDSEATVNPAATEVCDGIDNNCDDIIDEGCGGCTDNDGDGYGNGPDCLGPDCDDTDPSINPGASEVCGNGIDENCDGQDDVCPNCTDNDGDGYGEGSDCLGPDCNDADPSINPGASEVCDDDIDNNCDGTVDENCGGCVPTASKERGCDCFDNTDNDCDGSTDSLDRDCRKQTCDTCFDDDSDGWYTCGGDCDDNDPDIYPGAPLLCDGKDNDCDGSIDFSTDVDNDGDGVPLCAGDCDDNDPFACCDADGDGYGTLGGFFCPNGTEIDCNDYDSTIHPGAPLLCDGKDNDCDGLKDFLQDEDKDNDGVLWCAGDCDDNNSNIYPGNYENDHCGNGPLCSDGLDNDCNGFADASELRCDCDDCDGDGYGDIVTFTCPGGAAKDCNNSDPTVNPGATEGPTGDPTCSDLIDNDCDGLVDTDGYCISGNILENGSFENGTQHWTVTAFQNISTFPPHVPTDGTFMMSVTDAYGDLSQQFNAPDTTLYLSLDRNLVNPIFSLNPLDAFIFVVRIYDSGGSSVFYKLLSMPVAANTWETTTTSVPNLVVGEQYELKIYVEPNSVACIPEDPCPPESGRGTVLIDDANLKAFADLDLDGDGYSQNQGDCDDNDPTIYPGAPKLCDGKDNNCDGLLDFINDVDQDGDGVLWCAGDCDDYNPDVYPGATYNDNPLFCYDGIDNDCDLVADSADPDECPGNPCTDLDGDGYGNPGDPACPNGPEVDCHDNDPNINPGADDSDCNGVDNNCSGTADDGYVPTFTNCGVGQCASTGVLECIAGVLIDNCIPGTPITEGPLSDPTCSDGLDNDCDGTFDDPVANPVNPDEDCAPCIPTGLPDTNCDGVDDDCDGIPDDEYIISTITCGTGECAVSWPCQCIDGIEICDCVPLPPGSEGPEGDPSCADALDNDCDDLIDAADPDCASPCPDNDNDGSTICDGDCNDNDPTICPLCPLLCDGKDNNCDGFLDFPDDTDADGDGVLACAGDCDDYDPNRSPNLMEGPFGDPTCADGIDNDCDGLTDNSDPDCAIPDVPHDMIFDCTVCHDPGTYVPFADIPNSKCEQCHTINGSLKPSYPAAPDVMTHYSNIYIDPTTGVLVNIDCVECHNPMRPQTNLHHIRSIIRGIPVIFTAYTGPGSFADGVPPYDGICEVCHTQTAHHQADGTAPGGQSHNDGTDCTACHLHENGFVGIVDCFGPHDSIFDCTVCHDPDNYVPNADIPNSRCDQCHTAGGSLKGSFPTAPDVETHQGNTYSFIIDCVECHTDHCNSNNLKLIRSTITGSQIVFTSYSGPGSFADGPPYPENICNTCHTMTNHHQADGTAPGGQDHNTGNDCTVCHSHLPNGIFPTF